MQQPASQSSWPLIALDKLGALQLSTSVGFVVGTGQRAWTALVCRLGVARLIHTVPRTFMATMAARRTTVPRTVEVSGEAALVSIRAASARATVQAVLTAPVSLWAAPRSIVAVSAMKIRLQTAC